MIEFLGDYSKIFPEILLTLIALLMLIITVSRKNAGNLVAYVGIIGLALAIDSIIRYSGFDNEIFLNNFAVNNSYIVYGKILILVIAILLLILYSGQSYKKDSRLAMGEFSVLLILSIIGMMIMLLANDFLTVYLGIELQSLCLYVLAAFNRQNLNSNESGLKYFVLGALASGILLYGISLIYGFSGTTNFYNLNELYTEGMPENIPIGFLVGIIFIIVGFAFKISAAPFHMWAPDVYQGAPTIVTAILATLPKIAAFILFTRLIMGPFANWIEEWQQILIFIAVLSMFIGAFGAIKQVNIKRLLAYSSIGHVGIILMGIAAGNNSGLASILIYLTIYAITMVGTFSFLLILKHNDINIEKIEDLKGLSKTNAIMAFSLSVFMFSMIGIPPFAGFYAKLYIFKAALEAQLYWLVILAVVATVISAYYYLKIVKTIYFDEPEIEFDKSAKRTRFVISFATIFNLFYCLIPSSLLDLSLIAATSF